MLFWAFQGSTIADSMDTSFEILVNRFSLIIRRGDLLRIPHHTAPHRRPPRRTAAAARRTTPHWPTVERQENKFSSAQSRAGMIISNDKSWVSGETSGMVT